MSGLDTQLHDLSTTVTSWVLQNDQCNRRIIYARLHLCVNVRFRMTFIFGYDGVSDSSFKMEDEWWFSLISGRVPAGSTLQPVDHKKWNVRS
jgi:hypothetical protein